MFQIISDIHIEKNPKSIKEIISKTADILIIAGDLGHVEDFEKYSNAVEEICKMFEKVYLVPGNHEYYCKNSQISLDSINKKLKSLEKKYSNFTVLINEYVTIGEYVIFGSTFWSYCQRERYYNPPIYSDRADNLKPTGNLLKLSCREYNLLHLQSLQELERVIEYCESVDKKMIVVTHYAPTFNGTLHPKHRNKTNNDMYCSNNDHLIKNKVIKVWIYGHTGYNGVYGKLVSNQIEHGGLKDAVLTLY